jgi:anti-anti-sigma factor
MPMDGVGGPPRSAMPPPNDIAVTVADDRATVTLTGEHEAYSADRLARRLTGLIAEGAAITVDLTHAEFIDSTVVGTLIAARRRAQEASLAFDFELGDQTGWPVRRLLEVIGFVPGPTPHAH